MATYVWWSFGLGCFGLIVKLLCLAFATYPRSLKYERWEDALGLLINGGFTVWAWSVLHI